jgi:hypothetical protein
MLEHAGFGEANPLNVPRSASGGTSRHCIGQALHMGNS